MSTIEIIIFAVLAVAVGMMTGYSAGYTKSADMYRKGVFDAIAELQRMAEEMGWNKSDEDDAP